MLDFDVAENGVVIRPEPISSEELDETEYADVGEDGEGEDETRAEDGMGFHEGADAGREHARHDKEEDPAHGERLERRQQEAVEDGRDLHEKHGAQAEGVDNDHVRDGEEHQHRPELPFPRPLRDAGDEDSAAVGEKTGPTGELPRHGAEHGGEARKHEEMRAHGAPALAENV